MILAVKPPERVRAGLALRQLSVFLIALATGGSVAFILLSADTIATAVLLAAGATTVGGILSWWTMRRR